MKKEILIGLISGLVFIIALFYIGILAALRLDNFFNIIYLPRTTFVLLLSLFLAYTGTFLVSWSISLLVKQGKGSHNPLYAPTKKLVLIGPYKYIRHPIILGYFLIMLGVGIFLNSSSLIFIVIPVIFTGLVYYSIAIEEKKLVKKFGKEYLKYKKRVPAFIPKLRGR